MATRGTRGGAGTRVGFVAGGHVGEDVLPEGSQSGLGSEAEVSGSVEATGNGASLKLTSVLTLGDGENVLHRPQPGEVVVVGGADGSGLDVGGDEDRSGDAASRGGVVCVEGRRRSFPLSQVAWDASGRKFDGRHNTGCGQGVVILIDQGEHALCDGVRGRRDHVRSKVGHVPDVGPLGNTVAGDPASDVGERDVSLDRRAAGGGGGFEG